MRALEFASHTFSKRHVVAQCPLSRIGFLVRRLVSELARSLARFSARRAKVASVDRIMPAAFSLFARAFARLRHDSLYSRCVVQPLRRRFAAVPHTDTQGALFFEIDGLSAAALRHALQTGYVPHIKRCLDSGSYTLTEWECDLSSQTSASQAGILLGSNFNVPAFRWYEKDARRFMVSSRLQTPAMLERRLSTGHGLLADDGASRGNMFSGDAPDTLCTMSVPRGNGHSYSAYFGLFLANPYLVTRAVSLYLGDLLVELSWTLRHRLVGGQKRIRLGATYPLVRAFSTSLLPEFCFFALVGDALRGVPRAYITFAGYDEVAHHSGTLGRDALRVLKRVDWYVAMLESVIRYAPRPYHLVILSDHGQSPGAPFRKRYGETLEQLVLRLTAEHCHQRHRSGTLSRCVAATGGDYNSQAKTALVLPSGNLGLIYFPAWSHRLSYEEIDAQFPDLVSGLVRHEGIGFVLVHSSVHGALALGSAGVHYLDEDRVVGVDPLTPYGPNAAQHLRWSSSFPNAADITVNSMYDVLSGEVASFEEQVGSHGGLGGHQSRPFIMHPVTLDPGVEPIIGAQHVHRVLLRWVKEPASASPPGCEATVGAVSGKAW